MIAQNKLELQHGIFKKWGTVDAVFYTTFYKDDFSGFICMCGEEKDLVDIAISEEEALALVEMVALELSLPTLDSLQQGL